MAELPGNPVELAESEDDRQDKVIEFLFFLAFSRSILVSTLVGAFGSSGGSLEQIGWITAAVAVVAFLAPLIRTEIDQLTTLFGQPGTLRFSGDVLTVESRRLEEPLVVDRGDIRAVVVDTIPRERRRRFHRVPRATREAKKRLTGPLVEARLRLFAANASETVPNLVVLLGRTATPRHKATFPFNRVKPVGAAGVLATVKDPESAESRFRAWGVPLEILPDDIETLRPPEGELRRERRLGLVLGLAILAMIAATIVFVIVYAVKCVRASRPRWVAHGLEPRPGSRLRHRHGCALRDRRVGRGPLSRGRPALALERGRVARGLDRRLTSGRGVQGARR